ncbi:uncharacterized protein isoform X1 [Leptinotarsa decemlineata]|uniref:uncharacterized protein isoform X1 n=1 Tax=Leptinotarsa decemlineata TaxID=7539 RepID=UPI003D3094F7
MIVLRKLFYLFLCLILTVYVVKTQNLAEVENLVRQWSPLVWMAPNEKYLPMNAEEFLRHVSVANKNGSIIQFYLNGRIRYDLTQQFYLVTRRDLYSLRNDSHSFIYGQNPNHYPVSIYALVSDCVHGPDLNETENYISEDANERVSRKNSSLYFYVTYWLFFPFNEGKKVCTLGKVPFLNLFNRCLGRVKTLGNHVGDWEHMSLSFSGKNVPDKLYLSIHDFGGYFTYNEKGRYFKFDAQENKKTAHRVPKFPQIVRTQGSHPVVFSAYGSHGLWSSPGEYVYTRVPKLTDTIGYGIPWRTWNNIKIYHLGKSKLPYWMIYRGKWGNPKNCLLDKLKLCEFFDGPEGILRKQQDFYCTP